MVFFLTAALYAAARTLLDRDALEWGDVLWTTALLALAYFAKPVAMLAIAPLIALLWQRARAGKRTPTAPDRAPGRCAGARLLALRPKRRFVCGVALGQRHHASSTFFPR